MEKLCNHETSQEYLKTAKPILFKTNMIQAILEQQKTVTRRIVKYSCPSQPNSTLDDFIGEVDPQLLVGCCPYKVGDILYVRETWYYEKHMYVQAEGDALHRYVYRASQPNYPVNTGVGCHGWRPSIFMPKEAARLFLRVTDVRLERLQEANLPDFLDEGVVLTPKAFNDPSNAYLQAKDQFSGVWDSTIKNTELNTYGWNANPWVWVIKFELILEG